ncbi:MAG: flagellar basal body P-ring protein FlgI [Candidatus Sericytochromatia bacterium]
MKATYIIQGLLAASLLLPLAAQAQTALDPTAPASPPPAPVIEDMTPPTNVRVKDVVTFRGARDNQLQGLGLVSGLNGTGDSANAVPFVRRAIVNMLERFGMPQINENQMRPKNIAAVMVACNIPPFAKPGQKIDVTLSSLGDAKSLQDGFLIQTPLRGADGRIYAVAQGPLSLGGFGVTTTTGATAQKNSVTVARIPNGALVEKEIPVTLMDENGYIEAYLNNPDFTTSTELADKVNKNLLGNAKAVDASTVRVFVTSTYRNNLPELIARIENLTLSPRNNAAKVVLDERTGTIVIGQNVSIGPVSVAHGGLIVKIEAQTTVSQPNPFSQGTTETVTNTNITFEEHKGDTLVLVKGSTVGQLVKSLNTLGVSPRDLITILQMIKSAGALNAHLEMQ